MGLRGVFMKLCQQLLYAFRHAFADALERGLIVFFRPINQNTIFAENIIGLIPYEINFNDLQSHLSFQAGGYGWS